MERYRNYETVTKSPQFLYPCPVKVEVSVPKERARKQKFLLSYPLKQIHLTVASFFANRHITLSEANHKKILQKPHKI